MPDNDLRTRISVDTEGAAAEFDKLTEKAQQLRLVEAAAQEKMVRDLSTMSVEEFDRQIKAEEQLLERLRIKTINDADDVRSKLVEQYAERKQEHESRIHELDVEAIKIRATGDESVEQQDKLRKVIKDRNDEMAKAREDEIKGLQDISARTRELHMAIPAEVPGAIPGAVGAQAEGGGIAQMAGMIGGAGATMQKAFAPLLRILGPIGIAFSLEQVVEKLHKANEELRVIRNNYADIAATMGDLMGVGGMYIGVAQGEMITLQRDFLLRFADAFDEKMIPALAATIQRAGVAPGELGGLTETAALMGMGAGISPQTIAQTFVRLYREFEIPASKLAEETTLLVDSAHRLRIPFEDLSKWTLTLAEQTRVYGFDVADSRRLVTEFAHELENGTVQLQDLVKVQKSMSQLNLSSAMGITLFLDQIVSAMPPGGLGGTLLTSMRGAGDPIEQAGFLQAMLQGQLPTNVLERVLQDERLRSAYGGVFDVRPGEGGLLPGMGNIGAQVMQGISGVAETQAERLGGGPMLQQEIMMQFLKMLNIDLTGMPIKEQNALLEGIKEGTFNMRDMMDKLKSPTEKSASELVKIGEGLAKDRATFTGKISAGMKLFWRDSSESIGLTMARFVGDEMADVQAQMRTRVGAATVGAFAGAVGDEGVPFQMGDVSQVLTEEQVFAGVQTALQVDIGTRAQRRSAIMDLLQMLSEQGRIDNVDFRNIINTLFGRIRPLSGSLFQPVTDQELSEMISPRGIANQLIPMITAGQAGDVDRRASGVQLNVDGLTINLAQFSDIDELKREIKNNMEEFTDNVLVPEIERAIQVNNAESGQ